MCVCVCVCVYVFVSNQNSRRQHKSRLKYAKCFGLLRNQALNCNEQLRSSIKPILLYFDCYVRMF